MLRYYDKIGLLEPSSTTGAGYRLYGENAIETIQQILFFRELNFSLKEIKNILGGAQFNREEALRGQREPLVKKRDRLNALIDLIEREGRGSSPISFEESDMTEYYDMLETFKRERADDVAALKKDAAGYIRRSDELMRELTSDIGKDPSSPEIQLIVKGMDDLMKETARITKMDMGEGYWGLTADLYLTNQSFMNHRLFPSNYLDREIRKDRAAHHRESTCFARSAATRAKLFRDRAFLSLERLRANEERIWKKAIPAPGRMKKPYVPRYALG